MSSDSFPASRSAPESPPASPRSPTPRLVLEASPTVDPVRREWTGAAADLRSMVAEGLPTGSTRLIGGPGTGKTSLLVDLAVAHVGRPEARADSVLVLTASKRAARDLTDDLGRRLAQVSEVGGEETLVRSVHSWAFAILSRAARRDERPRPQLVSGAEQDVIVRELLSEMLHEGADQWPEDLRPALSTRGFAQEARDFLLRAVERGVAPEDLEALGHEHGRPEWVALAHLARSMEEVALLQVGPGGPGADTFAAPLDAAELLGAARDALLDDEELLGEERERIDLLLVDDAQHLDPRAAALVDLFVDSSATAVVAGDEDQTVFHFRGADERYIAGRAGRDTRAVSPGGAADNAGYEGAARAWDHVLVLTTPLRPSHEMLTAVTRAVAADLPGFPAHRKALLRPSDGGEETAAEEMATEQGAVSLRIAVSDAVEARLIADELRQAHLLDGVPWEDMAIIVRSLPRSSGVLRRACQAAGVPLLAASPEVSFARQPAVAALLDIVLLADRRVRAEADIGDMGDADEPSGAPLVDEATAVRVLTGVIGGTDTTQLRALRREVRRLARASAHPMARDTSSLSALAAFLSAPPQGTPDLPGDLAERIERSVPAALLAPVTRVRRVIAATEDVRRRHGTVEEVLWAAWEATGLSRRWEQDALAGGVPGAIADRHLDAVMALFDLAGDHVERTPGGGVASFITALRDQEVEVTPRLRRTSHAEAVSLISAHDAAGREWDTVVVAGLQDGIWPALGTQGSLLTTELFIDILGGTSPEVPVSATAPRLADERRLFYVAVSRARRRLILTATSSTTGDDPGPSRFLSRLLFAVPSLGVADPENPTAPAALPPVEHRVEDPHDLTGLVAHLRSLVCAPASAEVSETLRREAAVELARLADAGVPDADPTEWWGVADHSVSEPLWGPPLAPGDSAASLPPVTMSPSDVEKLLACPLYWFMSKHGADSPRDDTTARTLGTVFHTLAQAVAGGLSADDIERELTAVWAERPTRSRWDADRQLRILRDMVDRYSAWSAASRSSLGLTMDDVEVRVSAQLDAQGADPTVPGSDVPIIVTGRIDRLDRDSDGRPVVIDIKTGKTVASMKATAEHAQLLTYQLALRDDAAALRVGSADAVRSVDAAEPDSAGDLAGLAETGHGASVSETAGTSPGSDPGGAYLVYPRKAAEKHGCTSRSQLPLTDDRATEWRAALRRSVGFSRGPALPATPGDHCTRCPFLVACPAQPHGRQVTSV